MDEQYITYIILQQCRPTSSYSEKEALAVSQLGLGTLRHLRAQGLVAGDASSGELRYSEEEVIQMRRIRRLQRDLGINLAGIEVILHLLKRLEAVYQQ